MSNSSRGRRGEGESSLRRRVVISLLIAASIAVSVYVLDSPKASAAPTGTLVYSTDAGATWTTSPSLSSGQAVLVRDYFDNDTANTIDASSVTTTIPAGFTRIAGTTRLCLNPGTTDPTHPSTETACNTDAGQSGPIDESAVWSGSALTISPTAGVYGQPSNATSGPLASGRFQWFSIGQCVVEYIGTHGGSATAIDQDTVMNSLRLSNGAPGATSCGRPPVGGVGVSNSQIDLSLLGHRYLNLNSCLYRYTAHTDPGNIDDDTTAAGTTINNTPGGSDPCPVNAALVSGPAVDTLDLLANRDIHLMRCTVFYRTHGASGWLDYDSQSYGTYADNTLTRASNCSAATGPVGTFGITNTAFLDQARGQGFVEFQMTAPVVTTTTTVAESAQLTAPGTGNPTTSADLTVQAPVGTPLLSRAGLGAALALAAPLLWWRRLSRRRGRSATAPSAGSPG